MAGVPEAPQKPLYLWSTSTSITVQLLTSRNSNGAPITGYEVWRDMGNDQSDLTINETSYDGKSNNFTIKGLTPGVTYRIASLAINSEGASLLGDYLIIGATELPQPTSHIFKVSKLSNKTAITVGWEKVEDVAMPVTGYIL